MKAADKPKKGGGGGLGSSLCKGRIGSRVRGCCGGKRSTCAHGEGEEEREGEGCGQPKKSGGGFRVEPL